MKYSRQVSRLWNSPLRSFRTMSFSNKVVLVTGAASGIGAATAELFAKEGATVAIVDNDATKLQLESLRDMYHERTTLAITANVADDNDVKRIISETINKFGRLDVLVNCAGILRHGTILDGKLMQSYDDLMGINLRAVMQMTCQAAPHLIKTKGNIVNVASIAASFAPMLEYIPYSVSKIGVKHFTRGAALELAPYGVRVNSVSPGAVRTNILINSGREDLWDEWKEKIPFKKICEPEEIANLVLYVASDKAKSITGSDLINDNGELLQLGMC